MFQYLWYVVQLIELKTDSFMDWKIDFETMTTETNSEECTFGILSGDRGARTVLTKLQGCFMSSCFERIVKRIIMSDNVQTLNILQCQKEEVQRTTQNVCGEFPRSMEPHFLVLCILDGLK